MSDHDVAIPAASFLGSLEPAHREVVLSAGRRIGLAAGSSLMFEGDMSGRVVVIVSGSGRVFATAANGHEVLLNVVGAGEILGCLSALDDRPHSASVTTLSDADVLFIEGATFRELLETHAWFARAVAVGLARDLRRVEQYRVERAAYDFATRLAGRLVDLADRVGHDTPPITLPVSQRELAEWCGASREAITKALKGFRARGLVITEQRSVKIVDLDALRSRAP